MKVKAILFVKDNLSIVEKNFPSLAALDKYMDENCTEVYIIDIQEEITNE